MGGDGHLTIVGRASRIAKPGGEMVSLAAVEDLAAALWPDALSVAVALPDPRKGERIVLLTERADAVHGPASIDAIGPVDGWEAHWRRQDEERRANAAWNATLAAAA